MSGNGQAGVGDGQVLHWAGGVLSAEDLRRQYSGQRELVLSARTLITPLALDELRARGIRVSRTAPERPSSHGGNAKGWGYAQENVEPSTSSAVQALAREGVVLNRLELPTGPLAVGAGWLATAIGRGDFTGVVLFTSDSGLACCVANKHPGLRAAGANTVKQVIRARKHLNANLVAIDVPGPTFFELKQMVRVALNAGACSKELSKTLQELDSHAHR